MKVIAETERLIISRITLRDASFFLELINTPHWIKYIGDRKVRTIAEAKLYLKNGILKSYKEEGFGFFKLSLKNEGLKAIGISGLVNRKELDDVDIGFALLPQYERKGYGYEASKEIMKLAHNKFGLKKVAGITSPINLNSIKLLKKLGLRYQKTVIPFEDGEELLLFVKSFA